MECSSAADRDPAPGSFARSRTSALCSLQFGPLGCDLGVNVRSGAGAPHRASHASSATTRMGGSVQARSSLRCGDQVVREREGGGGRPGRHAELGEDVGEVAGHGLLADHQLGGDLAVGAARRPRGGSTSSLPGRQPAWVSAVGPGWPASRPRRSASAPSRSKRRGRRPARGRRRRGRRAGRRPRPGGRGCGRGRRARRAPARRSPPCAGTARAVTASPWASGDGARHGSGRPPAGPVLSKRLGDLDDLLGGRRRPRSTSPAPSAISPGRPAAAPARGDCRRSRPGSRRSMRSPRRPCPGRGAGGRGRVAGRGRSRGALRVGVLGAVEVAAAPPDLADLVPAVGHHEHVDAGHVLAGPERLGLGLVPGAAESGGPRPSARGRCPGRATRAGAGRTSGGSPRSTRGPGAGRPARGRRRAGRSRSRRSTSASGCRTARRASPRRAAPGPRGPAPA